MEEKTTNKKNETTEKTSVKPKARTRKTPDHPTGSFKEPKKIVEQVEKAIEQVDVAVPEITTHVDKEVKISDDMTNVIAIEKEMEKSEEKFQSIVEQAKNDVELKKVVEEELRKAQKTEKKLTEIVQKKDKPKVKEKPNITYVWNGVEYDF